MQTILIRGYLRSRFSIRQDEILTMQWLIARACDTMVGIFSDVVSAL